MTTSPSETRRHGFARAVAGVLAVALLGGPAWATRGAARQDGHRIKPSDGNALGVDRFRGGGLLRGGCARRPCIALTFDDGPESTTTPVILDELERRGLHATFFVTGHRMAGDGVPARRNRDTLRDTWRRGHHIGNHTFHHDLLDSMNDARLNHELDDTSAIIESTLGFRPAWFRAPYGALHAARAVRAVYSRRLTPVFWAIDSRDWASHSPEQVLANVRAGLESSPRGGVILFHDTLPQTVRALPLVLDEIDARNRARRDAGQPVYEFVGLEELWQPLGGPVRPTAAPPSAPSGDAPREGRPRASSPRRAP